MSNLAYAKASEANINPTLVTQYTPFKPPKFQTLPHQYYIWNASKNKFERTEKHDTQAQSLMKNSFKLTNHFMIRNRQYTIQQHNTKPNNKSDQHQDQYQSKIKLKELQSELQKISGRYTNNTNNKLHSITSASTVKGLQRRRYLRSANHVPRTETNIEKLKQLIATCIQNKQKNNHLLGMTFSQQMKRPSSVVKESEIQNGTCLCTSYRDKYLKNSLFIDASLEFGSYKKKKQSLSPRHGDGKNNKLTQSISQNIPNKLSSSQNLRLEKILLERLFKNGNKKKKIRNIDIKLQQACQTDKVLQKDVLK